MHELRTGDLVFSLIGQADNAISAVTSGYRGVRVNHVGVLIETAYGPFVLEAFYPEVRLTSFPVFSRRSHDEAGQPRLLLARLLPEYHGLIDDAVRYGLDRRDTPYDHLYLTGENMLYCSELVVDMFRHANGGVDFFAERPMSFRDTETGDIHPFWVEYYAYFGMSVPEGEPGSNPGDISLDERLDVYGLVGNLLGLS